MERRDFIKACCYTTIGVPVLGSVLQSCGSIYYANVIKDTNKLIISKSEFVKINKSLMLTLTFMSLAVYTRQIYALIYLYFVQNKDYNYSLISLKTIQ